MAQLLTNVRTRFFDKNNMPLRGGKVWTYEAYTTTLKPTWNDVDEIATNTNPVILDIEGTANIFLSGSYRIKVEDKNGVLIEDNPCVSSFLDKDGLNANNVNDGEENQKQINDKTVQYAPTLEDILNINVRKNGMQTQASGLQGGLFTFDSSKAHINDGGIIINGWVRNFAGPIYVEWFGATEGGNNTIPFRKALAYLKSVGGGELNTKLTKHVINQEVEYHSNTIIDLGGATVIFRDSGKLCSALYNQDKTNSIPSGEAEIYYKNQQSIAIGNPVSKINANAPKKSLSIVVEDASKFSVGDYVFLSNGYCDMWRVMEMYEATGAPLKRSFQDWVRSDVDLWRCEIAHIKGIVGNTIYFHDQISNDYLLNVKKYGFFADENNREDHQGWNFARIERLGGASNCSFRNIKAINDGATHSIIAYCSVNLKVNDCEFIGTGQGVDFITCYNSSILSCYSRTEKFGQSIRRGSSMCTMANASADYVSGDCPLIIWEGANLCTASNISIEGTGGEVNHAKIGFYFNTCWDCVGSNFTGKNLDSVVSILFCRGNVVSTNIIGVNVGVLANVYASFDAEASTGTQRGRYKSSISDYDSSLFSVSESGDIIIKGFTDSEKYSPFLNGGRMHIYKSYGIDLQHINAENIILWNSVEDDRVYDSSKFKIKMKESNLKKCIISESYSDLVLQTRRAYLNNTVIHQQLGLINTHNAMLDSVKILGEDVISSVQLTISHYTRFINCEIKNDTNGIDFRGNGSSGTENWSSLVYLQNTSVNAPTRFLNYKDPTQDIAANNISPRGKSISYITALAEYPKLKTFGNPLGDGNKNNWIVI